MSVPLSIYSRPGGLRQGPLYAAQSLLTRAASANVKGEP